MFFIHNSKRFAARPPGPLRVDWRHPLFNGASNAIAIVGGGPTQQLNGPDFIPYAASGGVRVVSNSRGPEWYGTGTGTQVNLAKAITTRHSALFIGSAIRTKADNEYYYGYQILTHSSVIFGGGSSSYRQYDYPAGNVTLVVPSGSGIASTPSVYVDGATVTASAAGGTGIAYNWGTASTWLEVGRHPANTTSRTDSIALGLFFNIVPTPDLAKDITRAPWQIFAPRHDVLYFFPAGVGVTLSVSDLSHAHALDAMTLSQAHSLALPDLSHAHALDAMTLTQSHTLGTEDLSNAHALDAVSLGQAHVLALSDLLHAHALDAADLAAQGSLSVADLAHAQALDALTLTQAHVLVLSDLAHAHALDALVLVYGAALSPADLSHGHALDALTLTQAHLLAIQELLHAHALDAVALGADATLVVSDLLHAHLLARCSVYEGVQVVTLDPTRLVRLAPENRLILVQREQRILVVAPQSFLTSH